MSSAFDQNYPVEFPKVKVYKIYHPSHSGNKKYVVSDLEPAIDELRQLEIGDDILVECCEMAENEIEALPDFEGW